MRWTERQRAMLREMGVQVWTREPALVEVEADVEVEAANGGETSARVAPKPAPTPALAARPAPTTAPPVVADAGVQPADWLVVGDPLDAADPQQEQLLDNLLRAIGVSRRASSRESRAVFVDDPALVAGAIAAAAPRCVIALGRGAASTLLGRDEPIGAWRGRSHRHGDV
ncbi:MAG TPA: hypothetical protein VGC30_08325, partial [Dokdonella sp.]